MAITVTVVAVILYLCNIFPALAIPSFDDRCVTTQARVYVAAPMIGMLVVLHILVIWQAYYEYWHVSFEKKEGLHRIVEALAAATVTAQWCLWRAGEAVVTCLDRHGRDRGVSLVVATIFAQCLLWITVAVFVILVGVGLTNTGPGRACCACLDREWAACRGSDGAVTPDARQHDARPPGEQWYAPPPPPSAGEGQEPV